MAIYSEQHPVGNSSCITRLQIDFVTSGPPPDPNGLGGDLHITLKNRRRQTYVYALPSADVWLQFKRAPSKGRFYARVIKPRLDYFRKY